MSNEDISIIVPCYNVGNVVANCITSIKNQTYTNYICYLIDDGSTDNTAEAIKKEIIGDNRFVYMLKENGGAASARNLGIEKAMSKYITFIDSDDFVSFTYLEKLINAFDETTELSLCYFERVYPNKKTINTFNINDMKLCKYPGPLGKLYLTEVIKNNNIVFPDGLLYEDLYFFYAYVNKIKNMKIVPEVLYSYIQYENSISHTANERIYEIFDILHIMEKESNNFLVLEYQYIYHILIATIYKASFLKNFSVGTIKKIYFLEHYKYSNWYNNPYIKQQLPIFYKVYLWFLHKQLFFIIYIALKTLNKKVHL